MSRKASVRRETKETQISVELCLDGGPVEVSTGLGFYDHMLNAMCHHGGFGLKLSCAGDLHIDDHHTVEDCALALGQAFSEALGERRGIVRFGEAHVPMDEALARAVVDLVRRPYAVVDCGFTRERIGEVSTEALSHALESFATSLQCTLHLDVLRGKNDHHRAEAAFKAVGRALSKAVVDTGSGALPSTKGAM